MTTEHERRRAPSAASAATPKLYLTTALAAVYVSAGWCLAGAPPSDGTADESDAAPPVIPGGVAVWLDDLAPEARPHLDIPRGWHLAVRAEPRRVAAGPRVLRQVHEAAGRRGRVRTRSS